MNKNEIVTVTIEDMASGGEGIGKILNYPLFIKDAIIGDVVEAKVIKAKKNYGFARLLNIIKPSKDRVVPPCPAAAPCGGCQLQAMSYAKQLDYKYNKVYQDLLRIGKLEPAILDKAINPIIGMENPLRYRNKAQYPIGRDSSGRIISGFYAGRTHSIIQTDDCLIGQEMNKDILNIVIDYMNEYNIKPYNEEAHKGLIRHVLIRYGQSTGEIMVCVVINGNELPCSKNLAEKLQTISGMKSISYCINKDKTNVIMGTNVKLIGGEGYITDYIGDIKFRISPLSFYQVNPTQTKKLYEKALKYANLTGNETVWDLYCGIGTISLFLAKSAKRVYGVEIVPQAIEDAKTNAQINGIENVDFYVGKAEEIVPRLQKEKEHDKADVIVVDPPRKGLEGTLVQTIIEMTPERIVYVSCDPATLARDIALLREGGYELMEVTPVDMFPNSVHVETCVLLSHKNS
ncbi:MAG: 23S rRNA (uracil(1939)-C(5))-methyltransferase RlmD [Suipraeoptans sp.]